ncbi:MAG: PQQ-binding-like beta-propeller repeat protein [Polyangiales bacterium]
MTPQNFRYSTLALYSGCLILLAQASCSDDDSKPGGAAGASSEQSPVGEHEHEGAAHEREHDADEHEAEPSTPPPTDDGPASWTMMGHDGRNTYFQPKETEITVDNAKDLKEQWRYKTQGFPAGSPVIVDGKVYITATGGLVALDLKTGKELWTQPKVMGTSTPAYSEGFLYVHSAAGANLYKIDANDGAVVWGPVQTYPSNPSCDGTSSAIIAGDTVLVGHSCGIAEVTGGEAQAKARGGVEALSASDGAPLWTYWTTDGDETGAMVWSTVSVDLAEKVVYATTGNNYTVAGGNSDAIHAIDLESGERKWVKQVREGDLWSLGGGIMSTGEDTDFGANPILAEHEGKTIVAAGDKGAAFWALDRATGEILWSREDLSANHTPNNGGVLMNGAWDGQYFYVASNEPPNRSLLHVLDPKNGNDVREPQVLDAIVWGAPSLANGVLFVPVNSVLHVYNAESGEELTSFDTGGTIAAGAAAIVDGHVVVKSGLQYQFATDAKNNNEVIGYGLGEPPAQEPGGTDNKPDAGTVAADSFTGVYENVFVASCAAGGLCHGGEAGGLPMTDRDSTYKALVGVKAKGMNTGGDGDNCVDSGLTRVVAGEPDESLLVQKMEGTHPCGLVMPPGGKLSDDEIGAVRSWVEKGAKDD